jgi:hypothetical protein
MGNRDLLGERKGTDHAVFGGVGGARRAGRGPQPRPLHRLVRLVLPHLSLAARPGVRRDQIGIGRGGAGARGPEISFVLLLVWWCASLPAVSYDWMVGDKEG